MDGLKFLDKGGGVEKYFQILKNGIDMFYTSLYWGTQLLKHCKYVLQKGYFG